ncbi:ribbon-helix-helix protein, CopG family [Nostocoides sp. HKS02]|uniref:ribbon-helix-helix protein, CopG family n=1 Tax=Nostocoides sp. HKS02 TaxID=1813880 RepID=UPI0012B4BC6C|nr:ribbon-helix-helix protein, CopG family [Tetrasphaera sp. HKS02]QGN58079.1 ribbon-helix-helix protein, CopG family [Tetrasphaera sp. HKS02]
MTIYDDRNEVTIVVRLPASLRDAIKARAAMEDRSVASLLRLAARDYLASLPAVGQS